MNICFDMHGHISSQKYDTKLFCFKQSMRVPNSFHLLNHKALSDLENFDNLKSENVTSFYFYLLLRRLICHVCKLAVLRLMNYLSMSFVQLSTDSLKLAYNIVTWYSLTQTIFACHDVSKLFPFFYPLQDRRKEKWRQLKGNSRIGVTP